MHLCHFSFHKFSSNCSSQLVTNIKSFLVFPMTVNLSFPISSLILCTPLFFSSSSPSSSSIYQFRYNATVTSLAYPDQPRNTWHDSFLFAGTRSLYFFSTQLFCFKQGCLWLPKLHVIKNSHIKKFVADHLERQGNRTSVDAFIIIGYPGE